MVNRAEAGVAFQSRIISRFSFCSTSPSGLLACSSPDTINGMSGSAALQEAWRSEAEGSGAALVFKDSDRAMIRKTEKNLFMVSRYPFWGGAAAQKF